MEICVNDYVRERGEILKIETLVKDYEGGVLIKFKEYAGSNVFKLKEIEKWKHSENILDLIEIGDILKIEDYGDISYIGWEKDTTVLSYKDMIEDIKNGKVKLLGIVTKEQFNSIKYEVE